MKPSYSTVLLAAGALLLGGCSSDVDDDISNAGSRAEIVVTMVPDSVRAGANTGADSATHPFAATFEVVVSEIAGVSCNMISQVLVASPDPGNIKVRASASSATIPGRSSVRIPMTIVYTKVPAGGSMVVALTVNVLDASGNLLNGVGTVTVTA
jgi:hypothetical protein